MSKFFSLIKFPLFTFLVFVFSSLIFTNKAYAFSGLGAGSPADPFQITTCAQLQEVNDALTASYVLMNEIDCSATTEWNTGAGFIPLGNDVTPFSGTFDGQNYWISSIYINKSTDYIGLFGKTLNATITNFDLISFTIQINGTVTPARYVGGIAGYMENSTASDISASGTISEIFVGGTYYVGGFVGYMANGSITNSQAGYRFDGPPNFSIDVLDDSQNIGGFVGQMYGDANISNSKVYGNITSGTSIVNIGGFVGMMQNIPEDLINIPSITFSNFQGNLSADANSEYIGGFAGKMSYGAIEDSYSLHNLNINSSQDASSWIGEVGGFVGYQNGSITRSNAFGDVLVYAGDSWAVGGFAGYLSDGSISDSSSRKGTVTGGADNGIGGFIGSGGGQISNCFTDMNVVSMYTKDPRPIGNLGDYIKAGGFIGETETSTQITNSYSTGSVNGVVNLTDPSVNTTLNGAIDSTTQTIIVNDSTGMAVGGYLAIDLEDYIPDTTLSVGVTPGATSLTVVDGSTLHSGNYLTIDHGVVGKEEMIYLETEPSGNTVNLYNYLPQYAHDAGAEIAVINNSETVKVTNIEGNTLTVERRVNWMNPQTGFSSGKSIKWYDTSPAYYRGGFSGFTRGTITNSYWDATTSGLSSSFGGTGLTTAQMQTEGSFTGWDFVDKWNLGSSMDTDYPEFQHMLPPNYSKEIVMGTPTILINNGDTYTNNTNFNLTLDASGAFTMYLSPDGGNTWPEFSLYFGNYTYSYATSDGEVNLRAKFIDYGLFESSPDGASDSIILNTSLTDDDVLAINTLIYLIDALPPVNELTLDNADQVSGLRDAYDALSPANQALITNYATLTAAEARIAELSTPPRTEFMVDNYFSTPYWDASKSPQIVSGDFNNDGRVDTAAMYNYGYSYGANTSMAIWVFINNGDQSFTPVNYFTTPYWDASKSPQLVAGDFNDDGLDDIGTMYNYGYSNGASTSMGIWVFTNGGDQSFTPVNYFMTPYWDASKSPQLVAGDFNNDSSDDIGTMYNYGYSNGASTSMGIWVFTNGGDQSFTPVNYFMTPYWDASKSLQIVVGDFNGDALPDIGTTYDYGYSYGANTSMAIWVFVNSGTNTFDIDRYFETPYWDVSRSPQLVAGDFNDDNLIDIGTMYDYGYSYGANISMSIWVFANSGSSTFVPERFFTTPYWDASKSILLLSGDYNSNGREGICTMYNYGYSGGASTSMGFWFFY